MHVSCYIDDTYISSVKFIVCYSCVVAEPNDAVWWIDAATTSTHKGTLGLTTNMIKKNTKNTRYQSYIEKGVRTIVNHFLNGGFYFSGE